MSLIRRLFQPIVLSIYKEEIVKAYYDSSAKNPIAGVDQRIAEVFEAVKEGVAGRGMSSVLKNVITEIVKRGEASKNRRVKHLWDGYQRALKEHDASKNAYQNYVDGYNLEGGWKKGLSTIQEPTKEQRTTLSKLEQERAERRNKVENYQKLPEVEALKELPEVLDKVRELRDAKQKLQAKKCIAIDDKQLDKEKALEKKIERLERKEKELLSAFMRGEKKLGMTKVQWNQLITALGAKGQNYRGIADEAERPKRILAMMVEISARIPLSPEVKIVVETALEEIITRKDQEIEGRMALRQKCREEIQRGRFLEQNGGQAELVEMKDEDLSYGGEKTPNILEKSREERVEKLFGTYFSKVNTEDKVCLIKARIETFLIKRDQQLISNVKNQIAEILNLKRREKELQQEYINFVKEDDLEALKALSDERDILERQLNQLFPAFKKLEDLCNARLEEAAMNVVFEKAEGADHTDFNYDSSVAGAGVWESALNALNTDYADVEKLYQAQWPS